jgi:hypothetical protein
MKLKNLLIATVLFSPLSCLAETASDNHPTNPETWIAFLPPIFFVLIIAMTVIKLRNDKTKLSDLLAEKDAIVPTAGGNVVGGADAVNGAVAGGGTGITTPPQSVSRFIAFLSGLVALSLGVCISTFYMYLYFSNPASKIDLSNLTSVIWGLGIGVIPYGVNKTSSALKPNP